MSSSFQIPIFCSFAPREAWGGEPPLGLLLRVIIDLLDFVLPFTLRPLQRALSQSVPEIHHSDQGVQYLSTTYISTLIGHGIEISLAHRGRPWENGYAERLIRTLKEEEVHLSEYEDIIDARARIEHFILQVYNQKRPHSALGYLTPVEFEQQHLS